MKSLHQFLFEKRLNLAVRCDTNPPSVQDLSVKTTQGNPVRYRLVGMPLYLLWNLREVLARNTHASSSAARALGSCGGGRGTCSAGERWTTTPYQLRLARLRPTWDN
jgi:hypothetical protein